MKDAPAPSEIPVNLYKELRHLESLQRKSLFWVRLLVYLILGIILVLSLLFTRVSLTLSKRLDQFGCKQPCGGVEGKSVERQANTKEKALDDILEIPCPVRVFFVASFGVPVSVPVSWSFGADQCSSSEGFLVTFTPTPVNIAGEVILGYPGRCSAIGFIQVRPKEGGTYGGLSRPLRGRSLSWLFGSALIASPDSEGKQGDPRAVAYLVRLDVMTPGVRAEEGILVALKPTDEGRTGTVRNTREPV